MNTDNLLRKILGLPTKEDKLRQAGCKIIEGIQKTQTIAHRTQILTNAMVNDVTPRLQANINDLVAVGMLEEIIYQFEEMKRTEPQIQDILNPLYDIREHVHKMNGINW